MDLICYFNHDDGSLPEIEVEFHSAKPLQKAFLGLFNLGAVNTAANGSHLWLRKEQRQVPFSDPKEDAALVTTGIAEPFHVVLSSIKIGDHQLPPLGVFVTPTSLVIDYRMGADWHHGNVGALIQLLNSFIALGGGVNVANWWGQRGKMTSIVS